MPFTDYYTPYLKFNSYPYTTLSSVHFTTLNKLFLTLQPHLMSRSLLWSTLASLQLRALLCCKLQAKEDATCRCTLISFAWLPSATCRLSLVAFNCTQCQFATKLQSCHSCNQRRQQWPQQQQQLKKIDSATQQNIFIFFDVARQCDNWELWQEGKWERERGRENGALLKRMPRPAAQATKQAKQAEAQW